MNISNETKVGSLTAISIVLLILGFNFLKGRNLTVKSMRFYAIFENIEGLTSSNAVIINGKQVGTVYSTDGGEDMRKITVALTMNQSVKIPENSIAVITPSVLGTTSIEIKLGNSNSFKIAFLSDLAFLVHTLDSSGRLHFLAALASDCNAL